MESEITALILDALQPHSSNIKASRLSCVNWMVCFGQSFWRKPLAVCNGNCKGLWPGNLIFENYFCLRTLFMLNLLVQLQPWYNLSHFWRVVSADLTKGLTPPHIYSADGQIVIPLVSLAISQPGSQLGDEHTKIREHYILSHSDAEAKFHGCKLPRLKYTGGHWLKICTRQPLTVFFFFFTPSLRLSSIISFPTSSQWKK